ncbi:MAG: hypothetical protein ACE5IB_02760 [Candidatus Geothermarchaeales archaeon]
MFWVFSYNLKEHKATDFQKWLSSDEVKKLLTDIEEETGARYVDTYWSILGFGEFDCEDWWEVPEWAALDKWRESKAVGKLWSSLFELDLVEMRPFQPRMLRTTKDVMIIEPPTKEAE